MTEEQKKICEKYSERDEDGRVHCFECPLAIDHKECLCLAVKEKMEKRKRKGEAE